MQTDLICISDFAPKIGENSTGQICLNSKFTLHPGKYLTKDIECRFCHNIIHSYEEKETDVRMATTMMADAYRKRCDLSVIISADSDLVPSIERIKEFNPAHKIVTYFPPNRTSFDLKKWSNGTKMLINKSLYENSMLPEKVTLPDGYELHRPQKWIQRVMKMVLWIHGLDGLD